MIKNTIIIIFIVAIQLLAKFMALILMYASPDNTPRVFEGSIFILGSSVAVLLALFGVNLKVEDSPLMFWLLLGILSIQSFQASIFAAIAMRANPAGNFQDYPSIYGFDISSLLIATGILIIIIKNKTGDRHAQ